MLLRSRMLRLLAASYYLDTKAKRFDEESVSAWLLHKPLQLFAKFVRFATTTLAVAFFPKMFRSRRFFQDPSSYTTFLVGLSILGTAVVTKSENIPSYASSLFPVLMIFYLSSILFIVAKILRWNEQAGDLKFSRIMILCAYSIVFFVVSSYIFNYASIIYIQGIMYNAMMATAHIGVLALLGLFHDALILVPWIYFSFRIVFINARIKAYLAIPMMFIIMIPLVAALMALAMHYAQHLPSFSLAMGKSVSSAFLPFVFLLLHAYF